MTKVITIYSMTNGSGVKYRRAFSTVDCEDHLERTDLDERADSAGIGVQRDRRGKVHRSLNKNDLKWIVWISEKFDNRT